MVLEIGILGPVIVLTELMALFKILGNTDKSYSSQGDHVCLSPLIIDQINVYNF